jgi:hypothetical protein
MTKWSNTPLESGNSSDWTGGIERPTPHGVSAAIELDPANPPSAVVMDHDCKVPATHHHVGDDLYGVALPEPRSSHFS